MRRAALAAAALVLVCLSWVFIRLPFRGLETRKVGTRELPMTLYVPDDRAGGQRMPGVIVVHGFGSSRQVMTGFALVFAHSGYAVLTLDFGGHGANRAPLDREAGSLQEDIDQAYRALTAQPEVDANRVAILGHSMGSGAAMTAGIRDPGRYAAVIAVSPTGAAVTPNSPANLLLMAGTWESRFLENARDILERAGGSRTRSTALRAGTGRKLVPIPRVEHITILFSADSHAAALEWLDATFVRSSASTPVYRDRRVLWLFAQFAGWLTMVLALVPFIRRLTRPTGKPIPAPRGRPVLWWLIGLVAPFAGTGVTVAVGRSVGIGEFGGVLVGGALALWFLAAGILWLAAGFRPRLPTGRDVAAGVGVFAALFTIVGLGAHQVILNWFITPARLLRWPLVAAAILPWALAAGLAQSGRRAWQRVLIFIVQTAVVVGALAVTGFVVPGLYFVVLLLPALPLALGAGAIVGGAAGKPWAFGVGNALFLAWMMMAVFPMV